MHKPIHDEKNEIKIFLYASQIGHDLEIWMVLRVGRYAAVQELPSTTGGNAEWAAVLENTLPLLPLLRQLCHTPGWKSYSNCLLYLWQQEVGDNLVVDQYIWWMHIGEYLSIRSDELAVYIAIWIDLEISTEKKG